MKRLIPIRSFFPVVFGLVFLIPSPAQSGDVILQWFESRWETMERRLPDAFMAGYDVLWVPPPSIADSGGFSVGYDVFDRFDFGGPFRQTLYGTDESFTRFSEELDRAGIALNIDTVLNHNGFRDASSTANDGFTNFEEAGGYPGFVTRLSSDQGPLFVDDIDGDFHGRFEGGVLNERLAGLIDIAQEKSYGFIRHPAFEDSNNIPNEDIDLNNRALYPDLDLPQEFGRFPFNTANPLEGDPTIEDANGLLSRYVQWAVEVKGVDGFRLDAVKHTPTSFFNNNYDVAVFNVGRDPITGEPFTPFSYGEALDGNFGLLSSYTRKDGFGNRDVLDFPLFFALKGVLGGNGFGDMRQLEFASFDGSDGNANDGSRGVMFAASHDDGNTNLSTLALAHILTRPGFPLVYYNAKEFGTGRDFPKDGRGDALGNFNSEIVPKLVQINNVYASEFHQTRWIDENVYIYERNLLMLVGLNDRGDDGFDERTVQTSFDEGTVLTELTGNATSITVDPFDDIADTITVGANGIITMRVPRNSADGSFHGRGFVMYGPEAPRSTLSLGDIASIIPADPEPMSGDVNQDVPAEGRRRVTPIPVITSDTIDVELTVDQSGPLEDFAMVKLDYGLPIDANNAPGEEFSVFSPRGRFAGFEQFTDLANPSVIGSRAIKATPPLARGTVPTTPGLYRLAIDATVLDEGIHYLETLAFLPRPDGFPPIFDNERAVFYLDRLPPAVELVAPTQTGMGDITSSSFEVRVKVDRTVDNAHILFNLPDSLTDDQVVAMIDGSTQANRVDRLEWRRSLSQLTAGDVSITVVAFEETGTRSVTRFDNINIDIVQPETLIGFDDDDNGGGTTFLPLPGSSNDPAFGRDIVVRVDTDGGTLSWNNGDFTIELSVDDGPFISAVAFDPSRPINTLFQNDQEFGDGFDEFRYIWRGYARGPHIFRARGTLNGATAFNEAQASIFIEGGTPGPGVTITSPVPPDEPTTPPLQLNAPSQIDIEGTFDGLVAFAQVFLNEEGQNRLVAQFDSQNPPPVGTFDVSVQTASYQVQDVIPDGALNIFDQEYTIRAVASTGQGGTGISAEASSAVQITGLGQPSILLNYAADGDAESDLLTNTALVSAVSPADADGPFADFGEDGTMTEMRTRIDGTDLFVAVRGAFFGANNDNEDNALFLFFDANAGSGVGVQNPATELGDTADGLRTQISDAMLELDAGLQSSVGFDGAIAMTSPNIVAGYTFGTADLPTSGGSFTDFLFQPGIMAAFDGDTGGVPGAGGTAISGDDTVEFKIPLEVLGIDADNQREIALIAFVSNDSGTFPSPNTLPENPNNTGGIAQVYLEVVPVSPPFASIVLNEISLGGTDQIELFNAGPSATGLNGHILVMLDGSGERREYAFPAGAAIGANGFVVLSDEGGATGTPPPDTATEFYTGFNIPWDPSRGGAAILLDRQGNALDYVDWLNSNGDAQSGVQRDLPHPAKFAGTAPNAPTANQSLGRSSDSLDTDDASDWENTGGVDALSPTFGTANGILIPLDGMLSR